jgi:hypothetical protein
MDIHQLYASLGVMKKCCIFLKCLDIEYGCPFLIGRNIFDSSRTTTCEVTRIDRNVPLGIFSNYYFSQLQRFKIQHGYHGLSLPWTCLTVLSKTTSYVVIRLARNIFSRGSEEVLLLNGMIWNLSNRIGGVTVDRGFEPRSGQTKDYTIGICCFSAKHAALRRKSKDWSARNQNNVFEWSNMSTRGLLFRWASTIKIQLSVLV